MTGTKSERKKRHVITSLILSNPEISNVKLLIKFKNLRLQVIYEAIMQLKLNEVEKLYKIFMSRI